MDINRRKQGSGCRVRDAAHARFALQCLGAGRRDRSRVPVSGDPKSGQAVVEMVVSLLAIVVVVAALLQIGLLGYKQTQTMLRATEQAHRHARADAYEEPSAQPDFILTWNEGRDGAQYSEDDLRSFANVDDVYDNVLEVAQPGPLNRYVPGNPFSSTSGERMLETSTFVFGYNAEHQIPLLPAVRTLLYNKEKVSVDSSVYMIWTKGLY